MVSTPDCNERGRAGRDKGDPMRRKTVLVMAVAAGWLVGAAPAWGAASETNVQVTSPTGTYLLADEATGANTITVTGTSNGTAGEKVNIACYAGNSSKTLTEKVEIQPGGGFSTTATLKNIAYEACVLRAVPEADKGAHPPGTPSPFSGPTLVIGERSNYTVAGGPNNGQLRDYYIYGAQLLGAFDYDSLGGCAIDDSYVYDPVTFASQTLDYCNAFFNWENGYPKAELGVAQATRPELQVDGVNAYLAGNADSLYPTSQQAPGFPAVSYSYSLDPTTGNLTIEDSEPAVACSPTPETFPPTASSCSSFVATGVQAHMSIAQGQNGRVSAVTQSFSSSDGRTHQLDMLEENDFRHEKHDGELNLPWLGEGFKEYTTVSEELTGTTGGPGSFFVKGSASVPDGGEESAQGAVTFSNPPERETVVATTNGAQDYSWLELHYTRTVPASGSTSLGFTYSNAFLLGEIEGYASAAQASYLPTVAIAAPANGSTVSQPTATVSGSVSGASYVSSLVVDGQSVAVAPTGGWSASVPLNVGANTITAAATNVFGYTGQAQVSVTYVPPPGAPSRKLTLIGNPAASARSVKFTVNCQASPGESCKGLGTLTSTEQLSGKRLVGLSARARRHRKRVTVGKVTFTIPAGARRTVSIALNGTGRRLLGRFHKLPVTLIVTFSNTTSGKASVLMKRTLVIKPAKKKRRHHK